MNQRAEPGETRSGGCRERVQPGLPRDECLDFAVPGWFLILYYFRVHIGLIRKYIKFLLKTSRILLGFISSGELWGRTIQMISSIFMCLLALSTNRELFLDPFI